MKRFICIVLSAVLVLTSLSLCSCGGASTEIKSINGMEGREACADGFECLNNTERYSAKLDAELAFCILFVDIPARLDQLCTTVYDGENKHYKFTDEDFLLMSNEELAIALMSYEDEAWYVDGSAYYSTVDGEKYFYDGHIPGNDSESLIDCIVYTAERSVSGSENELTCHRTEKESYVSFTVADSSLAERLRTEELDFKIYLDGDNRIERIAVSFDLYGIRAAAFDIIDTEGELVLNFTYEGTDAVDYPENSEDFYRK